MSRNYVVCNNAGIPYGGQGYGPTGMEYGTLRECIDWINRDRKELLSINLMPTDGDYIIKDRRDWRRI